MHTTVVVPSVADTATVFPIATPAISIKGVASPVRLSESDKPVSELVARLGRLDAAGETVSITSDNAALTDDTLLLLSVRVAVITHTPSAREEKSQLVSVGETTNEQMTVTPPRVADTVTVLPTGNPENSIVGVESEVMLSEFEKPVSDKDARVGVDGGEIAVTVTLNDAVVN